MKREVEEIIGLDCSDAIECSAKMVSSTWVSAWIRRSHEASPSNRRAGVKVYLPPTFLSCKGASESAKEQRSSA